MAQDIRKIRERINFNDLGRLLEGVEVGELIGVHNAHPDRHFIDIGPYSHITEGDPDLSNGPFIHCGEKLVILMPESTPDLIYFRNTKIVIPIIPLTIGSYKNSPMNFGNNTYWGGKFLVGKDEISTCLEENGLSYVLDAIRDFKPS